MLLPCSTGSDSTLSATATIDAIVKEADLVFIDVRSSNEKQSGGVPDVPSSVSGKLIEVEFAAVEDKKLRGALRDPSYIEAQVRSAVNPGVGNVSAFLILCLRVCVPLSWSLVKQSSTDELSKTMCLRDH